MIRIIVPSSSPWDDSNALGNTLSNWFGDTESEYIIYNIYARPGLPYNTCCQHYLQITPASLINNILTPARIGKIITGAQNNRIVCEFDKEEKKQIELAKKGKKEYLYIANELLFMLGHWKNKTYKGFVEEANPDIIFSFASADASVYENVSYLKKKTKTPLVLFIADDVYGAYQKPGIRNKWRKRRFKKLMKMADKVYGASEILCKTYNAIFDKEIVPLYKGCIIEPARHETNDVLRIVYAGNLYYGRDDTLSEIAKALKVFNNEGEKAHLEIYTGAVMSPELIDKLEIDGVSKIIGRKEYEEIKEIFKNSDIVLHVESFDADYIDEVKYSFSTKIIDCLQSGAAMLIVGPPGIASVEYLRNICPGIIIDEFSKIKERIISILEDKDFIIKTAHDLNHFAFLNHPIETVRKHLYNELNTLINNGL